MERLADPANYMNDPALALEARADPVEPKADVLGRLKAMAAWRELEARDKNLPRGRIVKDETLADIAVASAAQPGGARQGARSFGSLERQRYRGAPDGGDGQCRAPAPRTEMPAREDRGPGLGKEGALVADLLKLLLKIQAHARSMSRRAWSPRRTIWNSLPPGGARGSPILDGWRFEQFGRDALDLVEGRMAFAVRNGKLVRSRIEDEPGGGVRTRAGAREPGA